MPTEVKKMRMPPYARKVSIETRTNCIEAVKRLEEEIRMSNDAHNLRISALEARIRDCKETISQIDNKFATEEAKE